MAAPVWSGSGETPAQRQVDLGRGAGDVLRRNSAPDRPWRTTSACEGYALAARAGPRVVFAGRYGNKQRGENTQDRQP